MEQEEREAILKQMDEYDLMLRGHILRGSIHVEKFLDHVISGYYCSNDEKALHFRQCVLWNRSFNFDFKRQIFELLVANIKPELIEKYKDELSKIEKLTRYRNAVAHALIDISDDGILAFKKTLTISYLRYESGKSKRNPIEFNKIVEIVEGIVGLAEITIEILNHLKKPDESPSE